MPNLEEHCQRTKTKYKVEGKDIHKWLDEPSQTYASSHRQFRHDTKTVKLVGELFGKNYGKELSENIALDHIMADHEDEVKNRNSNIIINFPPKTEIPTIPCSYCHTLLKPSDQTCPNCGASRTKIIERFDHDIEMEKLRIQEEKKLQKKLLLRECGLREQTPEVRSYMFFNFTNSDQKFDKKLDELSLKILKEDIEKIGEHPNLAPRYLELLRRYHPELLEAYSTLLDKSK
jgi:hypothetical protein